MHGFRLFVPLTLRLLIELLPPHQLEVIPCSRVFRFRSATGSELRLELVLERGEVLLSPNLPTCSTP